MEYHFPIIVLFVSVFIFHALFIFIFPKSKKFWKIIDYVWISLGIIGIIGSTFTLRKQYSDAKKTLLEYHLSADYDRLIEMAEWNKNYFISDGSGFKYEEFKDTKQADDFKKTEKFFVTFSELIYKLEDNVLSDKNLNYIDTINLNFKNFTDTIENNDVKNIIKNVESSLTEIQKSKLNYTENKKLERTTSLNWILLFFSPYLFAIALAIRLTKVTAELKDLKTNDK